MEKLKELATLPEELVTEPLQALCAQIQSAVKACAVRLKLQQQQTTTSNLVQAEVEAGSNELIVIEDDQGDEEIDDPTEEETQESGDEVEIVEQGAGETAMKGENLAAASVQKLPSSPVPIPPPRPPLPIAVHPVILSEPLRTLQPRGCSRSHCHLLLFQPLTPLFKIRRLFKRRRNGGSAPARRE